MSNQSYLKGKPCFSVPEIYGIAVKAFRSLGTLARGQRGGQLQETLQERIMLAVTAVNQCALCSYAHTAIALKAGLSEEEIRGFVEGDFPDLPEEEVRAVLFAQHYADRRGKPEKEIWEALVQAYGTEKAHCILAACRVIMLGNAVGIVLSSVKSRLRGEGGDPRSSVPYEICVLLSLLLILPVGLIQSVLCWLFRVPVIRFS